MWAWPTIGALLLLLGPGKSLQQCFTTKASSPGIVSEAELSGITDFGLDVYRRLSADFGARNLVYSPYSLWNALVLTYFGTQGATQKQMEAALRVRDKVSAHEVKNGLDNWYSLLQQSHPGYYFSVANRIYFDILLNLRPCIRNIFPEELQIVYLFNAKSTARYINDFVAKATRGLIEEIASPEDVKDSQMVVVNGAAFVGRWKYEFQAHNNSKMLFHVSPDLAVSVTMMRQLGVFRYGESNDLGARILELPYTGEQISMFLFLPHPQRRSPSRDGEDPLANMVRNFEGRSLREAIEPRNLDFREVDVALPKFNFSTEIGHHLEKALKGVGIHDLFDEGRANLTAFTSKRGLKVTQTLHKAFLDVSEEGTEAAAASAVLVSFRSAEGVLDQSVSFHLTEPFAFLIYDKDTKNPLFAGHVRNPLDLQKAAL
ncbi:leukocyte elastase inhibitor-like [Macrobrachium nipponense]|uniref:leukocyte elastase inhibitor-like n=1 Tax=Macrobrachium nipponense TaxID=159736 RepID=UPI0030C811F9